MGTCGHATGRAPEENTGSDPPDAASPHLAILLGGLVVAAIAAGKSGALPTLPASVAIGVTILLFFGASFAAIARHTPHRPLALGDHRRPTGPALEKGVAALTEEDVVPETTEVEQVYRWRRTRLVSLGVAEVTTTILAADARFSVHELERLLTAGCPLGTALRILQPV